jgi:hypothetical protein
MYFRNEVEKFRPALFDLVQLTPGIICKAGAERPAAFSKSLSLKGKANLRNASSAGCIICGRFTNLSVGRLTDFGRLDASAIATHGHLPVFH